MGTRLCQKLFCYVTVWIQPWSILLSLFQQFQSNQCVHETSCGISIGSNLWRHVCDRLRSIEILKNIEDTQITCCEQHFGFTKSVYQIMQFIWEWQRNCNIFSNSRNSCSVYVTDELRNPPRSGRHVCISLEHRCLHHNKQRKPPDSLVILTTLTVYMWI